MTDEKQEGTEAQDLIDEVSKELEAKQGFDEKEIVVEAETEDSEPAPEETTLEDVGKETEEVTEADEE